MNELILIIILIITTLLFIQEMIKLIAKDIKEKNYKEMILTAMVMLLFLIGMTLDTWI